jgi:predicted Zn-dependent peptidase
MEHKVEEVQLKCGAKGLLIDVPGAPVFCMEIWFRAGDAYTEGGKKIETAHAMEHLAFAANREHDTLAEVSRFMSKNGAWKNAHTSRKALWYTIECPDFEWERLLRYLIMQISTPRFLQEEFNSEMSNIEEEFRGRANNRWAELSDRMAQRFGWDFSETDKERLELLHNVTLSDVVEHYKKTHNPKNANFFIAGDLSKEKSKIKLILEGLSELNDGERFKLPDLPEIRGFSESPVVVEKNEVENVFFSLDCYADYSLDSGGTIEDVSARIHTLNAILTHGFHSRIFGKARKEGLAYHVSSGRSIDHSNSCSWTIYAEVGPDKIDQFIDLVVNELKEVIKHGVSNDEVKEATDAIRGSLKMENQTARSIMSYYRGKYLFGEDGVVRGDISELDKRYAKVNKENIQDAFLNLIKTKKWGAGFLGNVTEAQAKKWNKKLSEIFED